MPGPGDNEIGSTIKPVGGPILLSSLGISSREYDLRAFGPPFAPGFV